MRTKGFIALVVLVTMVAGGCAKPDADEGVASAGGQATPSSSATSSGPDPDRALKFAQCMRQQGLSWFPDPETDGSLRVAVPAGTDKEKMDAATKACKEFAPDGGQTEHQPTAEELEQQQKMSECMRANGIEDFPDPGPNGEIQIDRDQMESGPGDEDFEKAQEACKQYMPAMSEQHKEGA